MVIYAANSHLNGLEHLLFIISVILNVLVQILIIIESKSVWNSIIFHGIWNFFLASGIIFIGEWHGENAIFTIPFNNGSILLTGGAAGCEASLLSMAALGVMLFIAIGRIRENKSQVPLDIEKMNQNEEEV